MFIKGIIFVLGSVVGLFVVLPLILLCLWLLGLIFFPREAKKPADPVIKMNPRQLTDEDRQFVIEAKQREKDRLERLNPPKPAPMKTKELARGVDIGIDRTRTRGYREALRWPIRLDRT
jgi:hypothetical protein